MGKYGLVSIIYAARKKGINKFYRLNNIEDCDESEMEKYQGGEYTA